MIALIARYRRTAAWLAGIAYLIYLVQVYEVVYK